MKTIVLATDFSPNAARAAHFAGQLAHDQKARLILLHAYHAWPDNPAKSDSFLLSTELGFSLMLPRLRRFPTS